MPQFGLANKRQYARIEFIRGFSGNEPTGLSASHPIKSGETILSGEVVTKWWNNTLSQYEWQRGGNGGSGIPHFAHNDGLDEDVIETGELLAISCAGDYEIQIAHYKIGDTYNDGVLLTPDGDTGDVKATTAGSGDPVVGRISKIHGPLDLTGVNSNITVMTVIQLETQYLPNPA